MRSEGGAFSSKSSSRLRTLRVLQMSTYALWVKRSPIADYIPQRTLPKPKTKNWPLPLNRDEPVNLLFYEVLNSERQFLGPVFVKKNRPREP